MTLSLDATCSNRKMWHRQPPQNCIQMDIEPDVHPEVVGDLKNSPFPENMFDIIFFDPPHLYRFGSPPPWWNDKQHTWYGLGVSRQYIYDLLFQGSKEIKCILKPGGLLFFKWCDYDILLSKALSCLVDFQQLMTIPITASKKDVKCRTYWIILQPETSSGDLSRQLRLQPARPSRQPSSQRSLQLPPSS